MQVVAAIAGVFLVMVILWEGFETIVLPRRVTRRFRLSRYFFRFFWRSWRAAVSSFVPAKFRETCLSFFGPLSNLLMIGVWVIWLIIGFALLHWATGSQIRAALGERGFFTDLYMSGTTFFTLGLGDVFPGVGVARFLTVLEAGLGFGFLALVISYIPALNQSFARREVSISLLDARAGSPPCAGEMLRRHADAHGMEALRQLLLEWETWSAELLEGHISYPVLAYFRSQHDNQSWLGALTAVLDTCALVMVGVEGSCKRQAELTFAIARHAVVDLALIFKRPPIKPSNDRLSPDMLARLRTMLTDAGLKLNEGDAADQQLAELRAMYEPYANGLASFFLIKLPPWVADEGNLDNWQVSAWEPRGASFRRVERKGRGRRDHF
jgi:hypothetical protein